MTQTEDITTTPEMQAAGFQDQAAAEAGPDAGAPPLTRSRPKSLIGNGLWSVLLTVWITGVTFFLTPFLILKIGTDHYGLFILLMSISGMMGLLDLGLGEATLRYVAFYYGRNDMEGINRVMGATFAVYLVMGLIGWAAMFFGAGWIASLLSLSDADRQLAVGLMRLTAFTFGLSLVGGVFASVPQALQRFDVSTKIGIAQSIFQVAGTVTLLVAGFGIYQLVLWGVATAAFTQAVYTINAKRLLPGLRIRPSPSRDGLREVFGYGLISFSTSVINTINWNVDRFLLGILVTATAVAKLVVPQQIALRGHFLIRGACSGLFPRFSAERETQVRQSLFLHATWIATAASVILFVPTMVVLPRFLLWWLGPDFGSNAAFIGQLICIGCILRGPGGVIDAAFKGCGKPQYLTLEVIILGILGITTNVILISLLGLSGAGYSYVITGLIFPCMLAVAWRSVMSGRRIAALLRPVGLPLLIGLLFSGLALALRGTLDHSSLSVLLGAMAAAMAAAAGLLVGLDYVLGGKDSYGIPAIRRCLGVVRRMPTPSSSTA